MAYYPFSPEFGARYVLLNYDGSRAVFNDPTDPDNVGAITADGGVTGLDSADVRESASELVQADGGVHGDFYYGRRPIVINAILSGHGSVRERNIRADKARRASNSMRGDAVLSWKPATRQENWVENPKAANNVSGWFAPTTGTTVTRITTNTPTGFTTAAQWAGTASTTAAAVATGRAGATSVSNGAFSVNPGQTYSVMMTSMLASVTSGAVSNLQARIYWYKADGSASAITSSASAMTLTSPVIGTSYMLYGSLVAPADAALGVPRAYASMTNPTTFAINVSGVLFTPGALPGGYFDGDTAGNYWQGDANASASGDFIEMQTWVRRQQPFRESGGWVKSIQIPLVSQYAPLFSSAITNGTSGVPMENSGSAPVFPIVRITGPSSNPTITDGTRTFKTQNLNGGVGSDPTLSASETLVVDMQNHTASISGGTRNGQSGNRYIDFNNTSWPFLAAGASTTFTLGGGGTATVQYRDAWL